MVPDPVLSPGLDASMLSLDVEDRLIGFHMRHAHVPEVWSHSAPRQLLVGFSSDAAPLAQTPPEQLSSPDSSYDHRN